ncbi:hypothetical protein AAHC03_012921 [Spirometra sp. Aus1]
MDEKAACSQPTAPPPPYSPANYTGVQSPQAPLMPPPGWVPSPQPGGSPYPPPPAVTCQPVTNVNIVTGGSGLKPPPRFGPYAVQAHCPRCNLDSFTAIERKNGCLAWLCCFLIFIFGGVFFCCFIPFCCARCQDVQHRCPNCKKQLGYYRRL